MVPSKMQQWVLCPGSSARRLVLQETPIPEVADYDVLIKFHAVSLNYRDLSIIENTYSLVPQGEIIPGADGAGEVVRVGSKTTRFRIGQRVAPIVFPGFRSASVTLDQIVHSLGTFVPGTFREYGPYHEDDVVEIPKNLSYREAATLPCAALTAWNALYGSPARPLRPGQVVVTEGTGGVSMFALQFAKVGGAFVISTTGSATKEHRLTAIGADRVVNYTTEENWGETIKQLSPFEHGADVVVEVGGVESLRQAMKGAAIQAEIAIIGDRGNNPEGVATQHPSIHMSLLNFRQVILGSRLQFEEMNRAIVTNDIHPIVDSAVFEFQDMCSAYNYYTKQLHFGKVVINIGHI